MLLRFLVKRMAAAAMAAMALAFAIDGFNHTVPLGILLGGLVALLKTRLNTRAISAAAMGGAPVKSGLVQLLSQILSLLLLAVAAFADVRLFAGVTAGLLLLPLYICFNAATEWLGLSHNAWGEGRQAWRAP